MRENIRTLLMNKSNLKVLMKKRPVGRNALAMADGKTERPLLFTDLTVQLKRLNTLLVDLCYVPLFAGL